MKIQSNISTMARLKYYWIFSLCLDVHILLTSLPVSDALGQSEIHEKIHYHLRELNNGLQELRASNSHVIHKRSILDHDELIYNSLRAFCTELDPGDEFPTETNSNKTSTVKPTGLKSLVIPPPKKMDVPDTSPISTWPHLFPLKVQAERDGPSVWLVFDVIHTAPVSVSRFHSFHVQNAFIDYPDQLLSDSASSSPPPVTSKVRLHVDASVCEYATRPYDDHSAEIGFMLSGKQSYLVTTTINLCMFDYFLNGTKDDGDDKWDIRKERIINETISPPFFQITSSDPGDEMVVHKGHNVVLELDVHLKGYLGMTFDAKIWDRRVKRKLLKSTIRLNNDRGTAKVFPAETNSDNLLSVEILEQMSMGSSQIDKDSGPYNETNTDDDESHVRVKVRVTIETSSGRRSGKLFLVYHKHIITNNVKQNIVGFLFSARTILLKLPNKSSIFPKNYIEIDDTGRPFQCDNDGVRAYSKHGKNCTVHCYARGTDLKDISISTTQPQQGSPVNSVSHVYEGATSAFAMIDVGPASKEIEGAYTCTATTSNGKKKKHDVKLFTSLFTKVFYNITVWETKDFTAVVLCSAFGAQPLNMSLYVSIGHEKPERVDNKSISGYMSIFGHMSNLTAELPIIGKMNNPDATITCEAKGERGMNSASLRLNEHIKYSPSPVINRDSNYTNVTRHENGVLGIHCEAKGGEPLEFIIRNGREAIGHNPGSNRTITETPRGKLLSVFDSTDNFIPWKTIACQVKNSYGEVWYDIRR